MTAAGRPEAVRLVWNDVAPAPYRSITVTALVRFEPLGRKVCGRTRQVACPHQDEFGFVSA